MELILKRIAKKEKYTIGRLYINGEYLMDTIEDRDRGLHQSMSLDQIKKIKIASQTAIPAGTYTITMNVKSPKFYKKAYYKSFCNGYVPRLLDVPGYDGILIHRGVDQDSSAGCIIVGYNTIVGKVTYSKEAFEKLYKVLKTASDAGEKITITIE